MKWDLKGYLVSGVYDNISHISGIVLVSQKDKFGKVQHTVELNRPMKVGGRKKTRVIVNDSDLTRIIPPFDRNQD